MQTGRFVMPRKPRFNLQGIPQHVIQRGNNRIPCFYTEKDYRHYLSDLSEAANKYCCEIHAYVMMTNHVHMLITPLVDQGISRMMQALGRRYVSYINKTHQRTGTLWEGRFKSSLIDSDQYLLTCMRYIELNPVRASMVKHPSQYKWSSYQANAWGQKNELLKEHFLYTQLGDSSAEREQAYRDLFLGHIDSETVHQIREALNHEIVLGPAKFQDLIETMTNRPSRLCKRGRPKIEKNRNSIF
jgi:putative transposase